MAHLLAKRVVLGTGAATTALLTMQPVHLEAEKKSIYDVEETKKTASMAKALGEQTTRIAQLTGQLRQQTTCILSAAQGQAQEAVSRWISVEKKVERVVQSMVAPNEKLLPAMVYVGVGALAGPIFMRRRNVLVRMASPLVFGVGTMAYMMPGTSMTVLRGVWARYGDPEKIDQVQDWTRQAVQKLDGMQSAVVGWVEQLRLSLQEGKSIAEAVAQPQAEHVKRVVEEAAQAVPENVMVAAEKAAAENVEQAMDKTEQAADKIEKAADKIEQTINKAQDSKKQSDLPLGFKSN